MLYSVFPIMWWSFFKSNIESYIKHIAEHDNSLTEGSLLVANGKGRDLIRDPDSGTCWNKFQHIWYSDWHIRYQHSLSQSALFLLCVSFSGRYCMNRFVDHLFKNLWSKWFYSSVSPTCGGEKVEQTLRSIQSNGWLPHYHWHLWTEMNQ